MASVGGQLDGPRETALAVAGARGLALATHRLEHCRALPEVIDQTLRLARDLLGAQSVALCRIEQETASVIAVAPVPVDAPTRSLAAETFRAEDRPALSELIRDRSSWVAHSTAAVGPSDDAGDAIESAALTALGAASGLASPILVNGAIWGQLVARRDLGSRLFDVGDVATSEVLAALVGSAIARVDVEEQVRHLVADDPLTGLGNRRVADHAADEALETSLETCIVMADVDGLKRINDELGHDAGDDLLRSVADVLRRVEGQLPGSTAARLGGDEFCLVSIGIPRDTVRRVLASTLKRYPLAHGAAISWGVASSADGRPDHPRDLFRRADAAQYQAKRSRARAARARARRAGEQIVTVDRLVVSGVTAISGAKSGAVTRLCALAAAATGTLGGAEWSLLRDAGDGVSAAVARGGMPADDIAHVRRVAVAHAPWVVEVETTVPESDAPRLVDALQLLVDLAVEGAT